MTVCVLQVTQYECGDLMSPGQDCLQYLTATTGTIASFNWDTSTTTVATTQYHLSSQQYDICIRRARSYCSVCYSPQIISTTTGTASSYGVGASSLGPAQTGALGSYCTGLTTLSATATSTAGQGDWLEIASLQPSIGSSGTVGSSTRICGALFNAASPVTVHVRTHYCSHLI